MTATERPLYQLVHPEHPKLALAVFAFPGVCTMVEGTDDEGSEYRRQWSGSYAAIDVLNYYRSVGCRQA